MPGQAFHRYKPDFIWPTAHFLFLHIFLIFGLTISDSNFLLILISTASRLLFWSICRLKSAFKSKVKFFISRFRLKILRFGPNILFGWISQLLPSQLTCSFFRNFILMPFYIGIFSDASQIFPLFSHNSSKILCRNSTDFNKFLWKNTCHCRRMIFLSFSSSILQFILLFPYLIIMFQLHHSSFST